MTFNAVYYEFIEAYADGAYWALMLEYMPYGDLKKIISPDNGRG